MADTQPKDYPALTVDELLKPIEKKDQAAALSAEETVLNQHMMQIMEIIQKYDIAPHDLISSRIERQSSLPLQMRQEIGNLQGMIRHIIRKTAEHIENRRYQKWEGEIDKNYMAFEKERARKLIAAEKQVNISCQSLRLAVSQFTDLNRLILAQLADAEQSQNAPVVKQMLLANAILVYELCDFVIQFIENFQVSGINELRAVKTEVELAGMRFRQNLEEREKQAKEPGITEAQHNATMEQIKLYREALEKVEQEWNTYWEQLEEVSKKPQVYIAKLPGLRLKRSNAEDRIDFITLLQLHTLIGENLDALNLAVEDIDKLEMPRMTPERLRLLRGDFSLK